MSRQYIHFWCTHRHLFCVPYPKCGHYPLNKVLLKPKTDDLTHPMDRFAAHPE